MILSTAPILFTIGYQQRSLDEFVALLLDASIDVLVDVRETAWSRKPGFSKRSLSHALGDHEIAYVHAKFAGNPKHLRTSATSHRECLRLYARHIESNTAIIESFDELIGRLLDAGKRVCVTCYERHPDDCHRGLLADRWQEGTYREVRHLGADDSCRIR